MKISAFNEQIAANLVEPAPGLTSTVVDNNFIYVTVPNEDATESEWVSKFVMFRSYVFASTRYTSTNALNILKDAHTIPVMGGLEYHSSEFSKVLHTVAGIYDKHKKEIACLELVYGNSLVILIRDYKVINKIPMSIKINWSVEHGNWPLIGIDEDLMTDDEYWINKFFLTAIASITYDNFTNSSSYTFRLNDVRASVYGSTNQDLSDLVEYCKCLIASKNNDLFGEKRHTDISIEVDMGIRTLALTFRADDTCISRKIFKIEPEAKFNVKFQPSN